MAEAPLKIVIVDDSPDDVALTEGALRHAEIAFVAVHASDDDAIRRALVVESPDIVLCYVPPGQTGELTVLKLVRGRRRDIPVIVVASPLFEDRALTALQYGAVDYVLKPHLARLPSAVRRAVRDTRERQRLHNALFTAEVRVLRHTDRVKAMWKIASNDRLRGDERIRAMLAESARSIRVRQAFAGVVARVEGDEAVVICVAGDTSEIGPIFRTGARYPLAQTSVGLAGTSQYYDVVAADSGAPAAAVAAGWGSIISTTFSAGSTDYHLVFASVEHTDVPFGADDVAYIEVLAGTFASQFEVDELDTSLREAEERSHAHAERLEALWRSANDPRLRDADLWRAMLHDAASSIRTGSRFYAWFGRVQGRDAVVECVVRLDEEVGGAAAGPGMVGDILPLENTIIGRMLDDGVEFRAWDDLRDTQFESPGSRANGWRALIVTTFSAGGATYVLLFVSGDPTTVPFDAHDHAYIRILASFFGRHVQERWQFDRLSYQQSHDMLTGLYGRSHFRSIARAAAATSNGFAIIVIDVHAFHEVNEVYGTMIGDALLVEAGAALQRRTTGDEILGRIAGDVFCVFVPAHAAGLTPRDRARHFSESFVQPFSTGDRAGREFVALSACIGYAVADGWNASLDDVLLHANAALSAAKENGSGSVTAYEPGMEGESQRRAQLREEFLAAVEGDQFELYYQPHIDLRTNTVSGCEALVRWHHPVRGLLLPGQFIPFAEKHGLIAQLDAWVMQHAFSAVNELSADRPDFRLYFNLSGRQAGDASLIHAFVQAARAGINIANIGVEITETDAMRDVAATRRVCRGLRRLNVCVAIDDFGTGYSSLSSLSRLPVDVVKIDRNFIAGVNADPHDETIAETIMGICERYGFTALAEGVEGPDEIAWLRARPCHIAQGFAFSHALPLAEFKRWVRDFAPEAIGV